MPDAQLSEAEVRHLAKLARLELSPGEAASLRTDLSAVLGYVDRLRAVDVNGVDAATATPITRAGLAADDPGPMLPVETLMAMAPRPAPPFVAVPKVLGDGGGA